MSNTARKARKRTSRANKLKGIATQSDFYVHTTKVGTPVMERAIGPSLGASGNDMTLSQRSKRQLKKRFARLMITNPPTPAATLELDPKPYRVGRKRFETYAEATSNTRIAEGEALLSPRSKYEQDISKYNQ